MMDGMTQLCFIVLSVLGAVIYHWRAYHFSISILEGSPMNRPGLFLSMGANLFLLAAVLFSELPTLLLFFVMYLFILLEYLFCCKGRMATFLFTSGTFIFHIMNVHMMFFGLFSMIFKVHSTEEFYEAGLNPLMVFVVLLVLNALLEMFQRIVDKEVLMLLIRNISQLYFVTTTLMIINVYLCMLGVCYSIGQYFSSLLALFLLSTSILLFGAFYTAFNHAVRMSVLVEYETKSKKLERQLLQSNESISQLETYVYLDPLTGVSNRRYGLEKLERLLEEKKSFCICYLDLDRLKYVNDVFGHSEGDKYILCVIKTLTRRFRSSDLCRMGGDEFMLLLVDAEKNEVEERLLDAARELKEFGDRMRFNFEPSVSFGVIEVEADTIFGSVELLDMADEKMYAQKQEKKLQRQ